MKPCPTCGGQPFVQAIGDQCIARCSQCNATPGIVGDDDTVLRAWDVWHEQTRMRIDALDADDAKDRRIAQLERDNATLGKALLTALEVQQHGKATNGQ